MSTEKRPFGPFPPISPEQAQELDKYGVYLRDVLKLKQKHVAELPRNIRQLSHALTDERSRDFSPDYMAQPATVSAYLHFFLPWNLFRLTRLLSGAYIRLPKGASIIDIGAGPLTMMQAMWIARPDMRDKPLTWHCVDRALKPMKMGLDLFRQMAGKSPWTVRLYQDPAHKLPSERVHLVSAANVLNEVITTGKSHKGDQEERFHKLAGIFSSRLEEGGRILIVEPGTRNACRSLVGFREALIDRGLNILDPCPHMLECPMPAEERSQWCHFNFSTRGAPQWLLDLSSRAKLRKDNLSLAYLVAGNEEPNPPALRVISDPFPLPGEKTGQYACSSRGLTLLRTENRPIQPGTGLQADVEAAKEKDAKSGAIVVDAPKFQGKPKEKSGDTHKGQKPSGTDFRKGAKADGRDDSQRPHEHGKRAGNERGKHNSGSSPRRTGGKKTGRE